MKAFFPIVLALLLTTACSSKRDEFESKLKSLSIGMTKTEVEGILGKPDSIETPENHRGTWLTGASAVWEYREHTVDTNELPAAWGAVCFDERGKVNHAWALGYELDTTVHPHMTNMPPANAP